MIDTIIGVFLCRAKSGTKMGEVVIDAYSTEIIASKTTKPEILTARLLNQDEAIVVETKQSKREYKLSNLRNTVGLGDSAHLLEEMPAESVDLIFTSPPYYNARPEYSEYEEYDEYLFKMRQIIRRCHRVLAEGRFFTINISLFYYAVLQEINHRRELQFLLIFTKSLSKKDMILLMT